MSTAVEAFRAASQLHDVAAMVALCADDVTFASPVSGRLVFAGRDDVGHLLSAVYGALGAVAWREPAGAGRDWVLVGRARIGPIRIGDAMVVGLDDGGRIEHLEPHLRPWLALSVLAVVLGLRLARHPGVLVRAARQGRRGQTVSRSTVPPERQ